MNNDKDFLDFSENYYPPEEQDNDFNAESTSQITNTVNTSHSNESGKETFDKSEFQDGLVLKKVKPTSKISYSANRIPADFVDESGEKIEISDDISYINDPSKKRSNLIVHRNANDEITKLEVICTCGEHTIIKLDFTEDNSENIH